MPLIPREDLRDDAPGNDGGADLGHSVTLPAESSACLTGERGIAPYGEHMSGVLHPAGPEPAQTYWLRRALVLLALLILVLVSIGVAGASMGATRQQTPAPAAVPAAAGTPVPSASLSPSPTPSGTSTPAPSSSSSVSARDRAAAVAPACERKDLKTAVAGKQMLKLSQPAAFTITVRNDSDQTCRLQLTRNDFELKITSGKQVLWSSKSCTTATFVVAAKLELDQEMTWPVTWDGRGTAAGCVQPGPELKRGTFRANAQVAGAKPAVLPVTLRP